jgi:hypothetical protein
MSNLNDLYKERTYPSNNIAVGMILRIRNCDNLYKDIIEDGTIAIVTHIGLTCYKGSCKDDHTFGSNPCRCRREIYMKTIEKDISTEIISCHCTIYTSDDRLIIYDKTIKGMENCNE